MMSAKSLSDMSGRLWLIGIWMTIMAGCATGGGGVQPNHWKRDRAREPRPMPISMDKTEAARPTRGGAASGSPAGSTGGSPAADHALPHVTIDRAHHYVDVDATVVSREGKWMELLACTKGGRAYESVLNVLAKPSHIHLALLTLGLKPGKPLDTRRKGDHFVIQPPHGPPVAVSIVLQQHGHTKIVPANKWIVDQKNGKPLPGNCFLFTGSQFAPYKGKRVYVADITGDVISLVNFGDELLARDTPMTNRSDNQTWNVNTKLVPPVGAKVKIRLQPVGP